MNVALFEELRRDVELGRARLDQRQRRLRAFLHHVAQLTGENQFSASRCAACFDEQHVAAHRRPRQSGRDARQARAHRDFILELAAVKEQKVTREELTKEDAEA